MPDERFNVLTPFGDIKVMPLQVVTHFQNTVTETDPVYGSLTFTPQTQMVYSHVGFDRFLDPAGAGVAARRGDSYRLKGNVGLRVQF